MNSSTIPPAVLVYDENHRGESVAYIVAPCIGCRKPFSFNPHAVPSMRRAPSEPREPICQTCFAALNAARKARGLEPLRLPPNAYEPIPSEHL